MDFSFVPLWFGYFLVVNSVLWLVVSAASFRNSLPAAGLKCFMISCLMYSAAYLIIGSPIVFWIGFSTVLVTFLVSNTITIVAAHQTLEIMRSIRNSVPKNPGS